MADLEITKVDRFPQDEDEARLAALGKKQAMKRRFNIWSLIFMSFCTSVTWEALVSVMAQALTSGGSSSMVFGFLASACGALLIALSISEFASIIPTSGGQYHYVAELSPPRFKRLFSWFAAWITMWGWITSTTSGIFALSMQIQSYVILFTDGYVYERWHTSLILIAAVTTFTLISIFGIKYLHHVTYLGITLHVMGYIVTIVYLLVKVHPKNTAQYVFTDLTNLTGWKSDGIAWSIGLMSSALGFVGWDSSCHMAEEMRHASKDLPRTMYGSVALSGILTFPWVIALMFCITDIQGVLTGPVGTLSPLVQLIYNTSGGSRSETVGITCFFLILSTVIAGPASMTASSRIVWSFAREGGLPKILAKIDEKRGVPTNALIACWFCVCCLSLIYIGNSTAYYGLASGVTVVLVFSYAMPIMINLCWGLEKNNLKPGPFTLGRYGRAVNAAALAWATYLIVFLCFPAYMPVTKVNMNYSSLVFGFSLLLAGGAWLLYGRKTYLGVVYEVDGAVTEALAGILHGDQKTNLVTTESVK